MNTLIAKHSSCLLLVLLLSGFFSPLAAQPDSYPSPELQWYTIETKHFLIHYHEGTERSARAAAKIAEEIYVPITSLYHHKPDTKVSLVFKDVSDYSNGLAYFFNNKIIFYTSPLDYDLRGTHNWLRNVIAHEFTHIVQMQVAMKFGRSLPAFSFQWFGYERERRDDILYGYPNVLVSYPLPGVIVPPWFAEGTAQYNRPQLGYEEWDSHRDMILRCYALSDSMLSWDEMQAFGKTSLGNESVYNAGYKLTRYISAHYGEESIVEITRRLGRLFTFSIDGAIQDVLEKSGHELYDEWTEHTKKDYQRRIAPVRAHLVQGNIVGGTGFGNFYPAFSPDGKALAYVSNKNSDRFSQSSLFTIDLETGKETRLIGGTNSMLSWSPDGQSIVYSKYNTPSVEGYLFYDLYRYDLSTKKEHRITHGLRAYNPCYSPDGKRIVFVFEKDGSVNLGIVDAGGKNFARVTRFKYGEQAFTPRWSPDGEKILFAYAPREQRTIAVVKPDGSDLRVLLQGPEDNRDPRFTDNGNILFASDRTGIFNIYRLDPATGAVEQLTNVIGGAFMPAMSGDSILAYALYTASGYKLATLRNPVPLVTEGARYLPEADELSSLMNTDSGTIDWTPLRNFDDTKLPPVKPHKYRNVFENMMFFPFLRVDTYNKRSSGLELLKPGLFLSSSDVLGRYELMAGGAINILGERDLFLVFNFRNELPLLGSLGLYPELSLEGINVTRKSETPMEFPLDTVNAGVNFNMLEFAAHIRHNIFNVRTKLDIGFTHSRYSSGLDGFVNPETGQYIPSSEFLYLIGNYFSLSIYHRNIHPARDAMINPVGRRIRFSYRYEMNEFNPDGEFVIENGLLVPKYKDFNFHRFDLQWMESIRLPGGRHTLAANFRAATIPGPPVNYFFDFYAGGITGMKGYSFYTLAGNEVLTGALTYRFPIFAEIGYRVGHILLDKLYGSLFFEAGDAWTGSWSLDHLRRNLKRDAGFEIRLEAYSFSMYPTSIFFSGAYGLDDVTKEINGQSITNGHEWRWYFGMLFTFDLTDGTAVHTPSSMVRR